MSRNLMLTLCATLLLSNNVALYGEEIAPPARQVMIKARVCAGDPKGSVEAKTMKVLAEPTLVTVLRRPASFFSGGDRTVPALLREEALRKQAAVANGEDLTISFGRAIDTGLHHGTRMEFLVEEICGDKVRAKVQLELTEPADSTHDDALATSGQIFCQKGLFPIGRTTRMTSKPDANGRTTWVDFTIELVEPATPVGK